MTSGKTQFKADGANLKAQKKRKSKKLRRLYCLSALLALAIILLLSLLHKPGRYNPAEVADDKRVPQYLTHVLGETINNGVQLGDPFDLVVAQEGINEVIAWYHKHKWSKKFGELGYSAPEVFFARDAITLMGAVTAAGRELIATVVAKPALNENGLLNLRVTKVKIGAVNITPIARIIAKRAYKKRLQTKPIDKDDVRTKIAASLLNNRPFDPVFKVKDAFDKKDEKVRVRKIIVEREKLILHLVPLPD
jgi:uncharacterized protein YpmS